MQQFGPFLPNSEVCAVLSLHQPFPAQDRWKSIFCPRVFTQYENRDIFPHIARKKRFPGCLQAASHPSDMLRDRPQTPQTPTL
jgi:hypothetical protein